MKWFHRVVAAATVGLLLAGCSNFFEKGSSADPPTDFKAVPGDGVITVTWTMASDVEYWLFWGATPFISTDNWTDPNVHGQVIRGATSPQVFTGLTNGVTYSFTINGRIHQGPGGTGTPSISAVPRISGATWTAGAPVAGLNDLHGVTYGGVLVAVGAAGALFSSPDGATWTAQVNPAAPGNLNAVVYGGSFVAAGAAGVLLFSSDAVTWIQEVSNTTNELTGVAGNGLGAYVAVGKGGTTIGTADGQNWNTPVIAGGGIDLNAVAYGNGIWVAVGNGGMLLTSTDAATWNVVASHTLLDLKGVTYGVNGSTGAPLYIAVGATGTVVTSPDSVTWTALAPIAGNNLNAVTFGRQFVAVGDTGSIFTSTNGTNWQAQPSGTSSNLYAVTPVGNNFSAVGAGGTNLFGT